MSNFYPIDVHVILECAAPLLAILLAIRPFPSQLTIERFAAQLCEEVRQLTGTDESINRYLHDTVRNISEALIYMSALAATGVAVIATVLSFHNDIWSVVTVLVVLAIVMTVFPSLAERRLEAFARLAIRTSEYRFTLLHLFKGGILLTNIGLIIAILLHGSLAD
jgi:VIT1/CCC1 family predicted Fe2+/Mn2+ transporter